MIAYLEIEEQLTLEQMATKQPQQLRIQAASKEDAINKLPLYEPAFAGLRYIKRVHYCNHDAGNACIVEAI